MEDDIRDGDDQRPGVDPALQEFLAQVGEAGQLPVGGGQGLGLLIAQLAFDPHQTAYNTAAHDLAIR